MACHNSAWDKALYQRQYRAAKSLWAETGVDVGSAVTHIARRVGNQLLHAAGATGEVNCLMLVIWTPALFRLLKQRVLCCRNEMLLGTASLGKASEISATTSTSIAPTFSATLGGTARQSTGVHGSSCSCHQVSFLRVFSLASPLCSTACVTAPTDSYQRACKQPWSASAVQSRT